MKLKTKYNITFLSYNLSTGAESAVRQRRIRPVFFTLNSQDRCANLLN
ncbi:hypothetical protein LEP1GSC013_4436 [Leptospira interrogans serovar Valbuzzi str. Duyster]|nr:hypothetical protein LEP1GSC013_4436 [Leptospira interrogans serovar Valbuzzi str. Duyster]